MNVKNCIMSIDIFTSKSQNCILSVYIFGINQFYLKTVGLKCIKLKLCLSIAVLQFKLIAYFTNSSTEIGDLAAKCTLKYLLTNCAEGHHTWF